MRRSLNGDQKALVKSAEYNKMSFHKVQIKLSIFVLNHCCCNIITNIKIFTEITNNKATGKINP